MYLALGEVFSSFFFLLFFSLICVCKISMIFVILLRYLFVHTPFKGVYNDGLLKRVRLTLSFHNIYVEKAFVY